MSLKEMPTREIRLHKWGRVDEELLRESPQHFTLNEISWIGISDDEVHRLLASKRLKRFGEQASTPRNVRRRYNLLFIGFIVCIMILMLSAALLLSGYLYNDFDYIGVYLLTFLGSAFAATTTIMVRNQLRLEWPGVSKSGTGRKLTLPGALVRWRANIYRLGSVHNEA